MPSTYYNRYPEYRLRPDPSLSHEVAAGADPSLVEVRGPARTVRLSVLAGRFAGLGNTLLLGTLNDLSARGFGFPPDEIPQPLGTGTVARTCIKATKESPGICSCTGRKDCSDMDQGNDCIG